MVEEQRILLVTFPGQGHINPALQFAKRLVDMCIKVTFSTSLSAVRRMSKADAAPQGLIVAPFSDGYDDGFESADIEKFMSDLKQRGSEAVAETITAASSRRCPFTHVIYSTLLAWVGQVCHQLQVPCTHLWLQPATILDIYYYYCNGYRDVIREKGKDSSCPIELPGLPLLTSRDLPSFLLPSNSNVYQFALPSIKEQLELLAKEENPRVLVNSFDALEPAALRAIEKLNFIAIGPLTKKPWDTSTGGDLFERSRDYVAWLDSKLESSVVYVSFGSISVLSERQMEETARGLLDSQRPFLWVVRTGRNGERPEDRLSCKDELKEKGKIVGWCSQVEVLSHPSVGCFVTHCGWNSSLESLVCGVPVVTFPQWTDQATNAKLLEDEWKTGVRVTTNKEGVAEGNEIKRCLGMVMGDGERGKEMRRNAKKWKDLAKEAEEEGGSSCVNLKEFVHKIGLGH